MDAEAACPSDVGLVLNPCGLQALEFYAQQQQQQQQYKQQEQENLSQLTTAFMAVRKSFDAQLWAAKAEAGRQARRAAELEAHSRTLAESALLLQSRLHTSHSVATSLQAKLQEALLQNQQLSGQLQQMQLQVALSLELSREGSGESEGAGAVPPAAAPGGADSAESAYTEDLETAHARALGECEALREQRLCRGCRVADVAVLLLPCRHLCVCKACEGQTLACPLCAAPKQASLLVHMS